MVAGQQLLCVVLAVPFERYHDRFERGRRSLGLERLLNLTTYRGTMPSLSPSYYEIFKISMRTGYSVMIAFKLGSKR